MCAVERGIVGLEQVVAARMGDYSHGRMAAAVGALLEARINRWYTSGRVPEGVPRIVLVAIVDLHCFDTTEAPCAPFALLEGCQAQNETRRIEKRAAQPQG